MHRSFTAKHQGFTLIELLVVIVIIGILAAIALPNYIKVKEKAKEAEVKANLHNIQLSVERFAVDTEGAYPQYLIGGEPKFSGQVTLGTSNAFTDIQEVEPTEAVSDPLIRRGYVDAFPRNPFTRNGVAIHQVQENLPSSTTSDDPLRNAFPDGEMWGTRFGPYCTSMGSVLADPRFTRWTYVDLNTGSVTTPPTWANVQYDFWDMWIGNKPLPYLPGQFFYKGSGPIIAIGNEDAETDPILPTEIDEYLLGGYGGIRTKGKDVLGTEQQVIYLRRASTASNWLASYDIPGSTSTSTRPMGIGDDLDGPGQNNGVSGTLEIWPWTRSEVRDNEREGSPWKAANQGDSSAQLQKGNPNATRDGIILMLSAGDDNPEER